MKTDLEAKPAMRAGVHSDQGSRGPRPPAGTGRRDGGPTKRALQAVALATAVVIAPVAAHAQDASVLVVLAAPPLLLAPLAAAAIRRALWRGDSASSARSALVVGVAEFVLWLLIAWFTAVAEFKEAPVAALVGVLLIACVLALHWRFGPTQGSWPRSLASASVFPLTWLALQVLWYGAFVLLG